MSKHQGRELERFINERRDKVSGGLSVTRVAEMIGVSRQALHKWFTEPVISLDNLALLQKAIGFVPAGDDRGKITGVKYDVNMVSEPGLQVERHNIIRVPLHAVGGFLQGYKNKVFVDMLEHYSMPGFTGEYWDFEVEGMSMYKLDDERSAKPGDRLLCKKMEGFHDLRKQKGYVLQTIDGICYKIFDKIKDDRAYFISLNEDFEDIDFYLKEIKTIYYVDFIMRKQN